MSKKIFNVRIDEDLLIHFRIAAVKNKESMTSLVVKFINEYVNKSEKGE